MEYYDYEQEQIRKRIKRRYDRRFAFAAHVLALILTALIAGIIPGLDIVTLMVGITLIPHMFFLIFHEYRDWLNHRLEQELYREQSRRSKPKRYPHGRSEQASFRLTDDGEIEEIPMYQEAYRERSYYEENTPDHREKQSKRYKKQRKDDTDEFDVRKLLKQLKDLVD